MFPCIYLNLLVILYIKKEGRSLNKDSHNYEEIKKILEENDDETPFEFIEDIPGLSELMEDEEDSKKYLIEEYPGLFRIKKKDEDK